MKAMEHMAREEQMGYTHYYNVPEVIDQPTFMKITSAFKTIAKKLRGGGLGLAGPNGIGDTVITQGEIAFNGNKLRGEWHDSFHLSQRARIVPQHLYCKTNRKPYDLAVVACLCIIKYHLRDKCYIYSDGDQEDWDEGIALTQGVLGIDGNFEIDKEENALHYHPDNQMATSRLTEETMKNMLLNVGQTTARILQDHESSPREIQLANSISHLVSILEDHLLES